MSGVNKTPEIPNLASAAQTEGTKEHLMSKRNRMAAWPCILMLLALLVGALPRVGPSVEGRQAMPERKPPAGTAPTTVTKPEGAQNPIVQVRSRLIRVRLGQLVLRAEDYSHRIEGALARDGLWALMESIKVEGLRHPPEVFAAGDGTYVVVTGHRRVGSLNLLAEDGVAGFSQDTEVEVVELLDTTVLDRLAWSVADNEVRLNLTASERFNVVQKFVRAGMPDERWASSLGLSLKQYSRDVTLVRNDWMLALVNKGAIRASTAVKLLEVAEKKNRVMELKTFFEDWVAGMELDIEEQAATRQLKPAEKLVRSRLTSELKQHWLDSLAAGKELNRDVEPKVKADLNLKTLEVAVQGFRLNLQTDPVEDIARVLGTLSQLAKTAAPILKTRVALEAGPQAKLLSAKDVPQLDVDYLREVGLESLVPAPRTGSVTDATSGQQFPDVKTKEGPA
jgi:ParB-like chromosome segregation protein Spo0J